MKETIFLNQLPDYLGKEIEIRGWLFNKRVGGGIQFLQIRDGTGEIQGILLKNKAGEDLFNQIKELPLESSVIIVGSAKEEKRSASGFEIDVDSISVVGKSSDDYPIGKKEHGPDFLLENRHLWLRSPCQHAIQVIRNEIIYSIYDFYKAENFIKIDTPIITPSACEGTTTLFDIDYFGKKAYLSQSGQLYLEAAIYSFARVFDFAPVFRAEKSKTRRHLIEFWMTDAEAAFVSHDENLDIQEKMIVMVVSRILKSCQKELAVLERDPKPLEKIVPPFPRLTYDEVMEKLHSLGSDTKYGEDLGNNDETLITKLYEQPIFVQFYPAAVKAFYMKRNPDNPKLAQCADLLAPEGYGEIIGGSQREDDYDVLLKSIKQHKLPVESFNWYLDLRKYGSVPHSGFGLGLERLVAWICGLKHVRETIPFPRLLNRCYP